MKQLVVHRRTVDGDDRPAPADQHQLMIESGGKGDERLARLKPRVDPERQARLAIEPLGEEDWPIGLDDEIRGRYDPGYGPGNAPGDEDLRGIGLGQEPL